MGFLNFIQKKYRFLKTVSHFKGYAVHSPFVFGVTEYVFPCNLHYYAHNTIENEWFTQILSNQDNPFSSLKNALTLHKYLVYLKPKSVLIISLGNKFTQSVVQSASNNITITTINPSNLDKKQLIRYDAIIIDQLVYMSEIQLKKSCELLNPNGFIIADAIHITNKSFALWNNLLSNKNRSVVVSTFNLGFLSFNPSLPNQVYSIFR